MFHSSRTTLRELKKRYLNILKKCLLANLMAFSFCLPSMAETITNPTTNEELLEALLDPNKRVEITNTGSEYNISNINQLTLIYNGEPQIDETGAFLYGANLSNSGNLDLSGVEKLIVSTTVRTHSSDHSHSSGIFNDGKLYLNDVDFIDNKAISETKNAHSVTLRNGTNGEITFLGTALFKNNQGEAKNIASSVGINNQGIINFQDVSFIGNKAITQTNSFWGVGIYNHAAGNITVNGKAYFANNYGESGGGYAGGTILYNVAQESLITFKGDAVFENNTGKSKEWGRSNFMNDGTVIFEKSVLFKNNTFESEKSAFSAGISNGGILKFKSTADFINIKATGKTSAKGGAIYNYGSGNIEFFNSTNFIGNTVDLGSLSNQGGAIYNEGTIYFNNELNTFKNNSATGTDAWGGAIYNIGTITFKGESIFKNNYANKSLNDIHNDGDIIIDGNMMIGGGITGSGTITIKKNGLFDIQTSKVNVRDLKIENQATLKVGINSLKEHGQVIGNITGTETSKLILDINFNAETGIYQLFEQDNGILLKENLFFNIKDLENGAYQVEKKTALDLMKGLEMNPSQTAVTVSLIDSETSHSGFTKIQEEILDGLQSDDKAQVEAAKKALKAVGTSEHSGVQAVASNHVGAVSKVVGGEMKGGAMGRAGGEETPRAKVYIKGLYDKTKSTMGDGFKARSTGAVLGVQSEVTESLTLGVGYATSQTTAKEDLRRTEVDTNTGFISAHYQPNAWWMSGLATYSRGQYDEQKQVLSSVGTANYDVDSWGVQVMTGYDIKLENAIITPEVGLRYLSVKQEGYTDTLGTTVEATSSDYLTAIAGIKGTWDLGAIRPTVGVNVGYDVITDDVATLNTLANGASYTVNGEALDRLSVGVTTGIEAKLGDRITLKLEYNGAFRKEYKDHSGMLKLEMRF